MTNRPQEEFGIAGDLSLEEYGSTRTEPGSHVERYPNSPSDPTREQWMRLTETSDGLSFWNHPDEDIYLEGDGEPV